MPGDSALSSTGVCNQQGCAGTGRKRRSSRRRRNSLSTANVLSNETAHQVCGEFITAYLNKLPRAPAQRDAHYNGTIQSAQEMCVFDVVANDASVSAMFSLSKSDTVQIFD